jgi:exopolyphosphatase/guanosine-5'-triphosphate,3'-diphosphate pyrophosphatase
MQSPAVLAAVDLGSNSFRLQIARVEEGHLYPIDALKESVRLAAGLTQEKLMDADAQKRGLDCLARFGERLRGLPHDAVRAVATNTLRVAKNTPEFLVKAEAALGFPIEVIAGREEARLIYLGVSHTLPASPYRRLVMDIGGGSTEFIVGTRHTPLKLESLYMGCVSYTKRFFPELKVTKARLEQAELAARTELQAIKSGFEAGNWRGAWGSSGTARALADILEACGWSDGRLTREGLALLRKALIKAGDMSRLDLPGLRPERVPVLAGGFAIMNAAFDELGIESMSVASGALREGVLYDLLGRIHHHDVREATVKGFMRRYHVDKAQAERVANLGCQLLQQLLGNVGQEATSRLTWAAQLHEIGLAIAHASYHRHTAYILANADMPGFSKKAQALLALVTRAQRGSLRKIEPLADSADAWPFILVLRLAVLFNRSRTDAPLPRTQVAMRGSQFHLGVDKSWLKQNPLTESLLKQEVLEWQSVGWGLKVEKL